MLRQLGRSADRSCWRNIAGWFEQLHGHRGAEHNAGFDHARIDDYAWYGDYAGEHGNATRRDNDSTEYDSGCYPQHNAKHDPKHYAQ